MDEPHGEVAPEQFRATEADSEAMRPVPPAVAGPGTLRQPDGLSLTEPPEVLPPVAGLPEAEVGTAGKLPGRTLLPLLSPRVARAVEARTAEPPASPATVAHSEPGEAVADLPWRPPDVVVQRAALDRATIQRAEPEPSPVSAPVTESHTSEAAHEEQKSEPQLNLDQVARQVYPIIKRLLAVESERRLSR
jgi:hypothetical protein